MYAIFSGFTFATSMVFMYILIGLAIVAAAAVAVFFIYRFYFFHKLKKTQMKAAEELRQKDEKFEKIKSFQQEVWESFDKRELIEEEPDWIVKNTDIRFISAAQITNAVARLCVEANLRIGGDIRRALKNAHETETSELARSALGVLQTNADIAESEKLPICQDTGMAVVFASIGENAHVDGSVEDAINEGVRRGYREGYLRNSVVRGPIDRVNTGDNTPAVIHYDYIRGDKIKITVAPKGFGSENMSAVKMLTPSAGLGGVEDFIIETVSKAGSNPCPPIIVGVGVGGTMEKAALLSKKALLRNIGEPNADEKWGAVESRLLMRINELGIGASGYGGKTTALAVHILPYPTHIAGLPVAVNLSCHATRHKTAVL